MFLDLHIMYFTAHNTQNQQLYNMIFYVVFCTPTVHHVCNVNLFYVHTIVFKIVYIFLKTEHSMSLLFASTSVCELPVNCENDVSLES